MPDFRVVLCFPLTDEHCAKIAAVDRRLDVVNAGQERIAIELPTADIFCGHAKVEVPWDDVVAQGRLQWIQSSAAGLDHCLTPSVISSEIVVTSASGLFADQVAEQTMALLCGIVRDLPTFFRQQQAKLFERQPTRDLHGSTVGIVGFGGNGRRIAEILAPFRVRILATDLFPIDKPAHVDQLWPAERLGDLLPLVDILILSMPLNAQTRGMIDSAVFRRMKRGSILINVARGPVVDEQALVAALADKQLAAAGLDVTEIEPLPRTSPLWEMPNVIITPHVGAQSARRVADTVDFFCENLRRYLGGEPLQNVVDKQLGFPRRAFT